MGLVQNVDDEDFSHKLLWSLPKKFMIVVIVILRGGLKNNTAIQMLGEIIIHDTFDEEEERSKNVSQEN
jgi:hypothetical protein